jgi:hypothetical protein
VSEIHVFPSPFDCGFIQDRPEQHGKVQPIAILTEPFIRSDDGIFSYFFLVDEPRIVFSFCNRVLGVERLE